MDVDRALVTEILESNKEYKIPIYQRPYRWSIGQCKKLFEDICKIGEDQSGKKHFIGSIIVVKDHHHGGGGIPKLQIVDGQQRLTTIILLLKAMYEVLPDTSDTEEINRKGLIKQLIFNQNYVSEGYYKIILNESDDKLFKDLLKHNNIEDGKEDNNLIKNFIYFREAISKSNIDILWQGIEKLELVKIVMDENNNPQAVFESMNSTGLDLSQTDLIKNYIFMSLQADEQEKLYVKYWRPMETQLQFEVENQKRKAFQNKLDRYTVHIPNYDEFDLFILEYLKIQFTIDMDLERGARSNELYIKFKEHVKNSENKEQILKNMLDYSKCYSYLIGKQHKVGEIELLLWYMFNFSIKNMEMFRYVDLFTGTIPFLLKILFDYTNNKIKISDVQEIFHLVESYIIRKFVVSFDFMPFRLTRRFFIDLIKEIDEENYLNSIKLALKSNDIRFPSNEDFIHALRNKPLNSFSKFYILHRLEGKNNKLILDDIKIEYIMPKKLTQEWKDYLEKDYEEAEKLCDNIGNLALVNPSDELRLKDKSFQEKLNQYKNSDFEITKNIEKYTHWDKFSIQDRARVLATQAIKIWPHLNHIEIDNDKKLFVDLNKKNIPKVENDENEFKEFFQYDEKIGKYCRSTKKIPTLLPDQQKEIKGLKEQAQEQITKAICSFGNTDGGFLFLGINADSEIVGLERDKKFGNFKDYDDEFGREIVKILEKAMLNEVLANIVKMKFREVDKKMICIIQVLRSNKPLFYKSKSGKKIFCIRNVGAATRELGSLNLTGLVKLRNSLIISKFRRLLA